MFTPISARKGAWQKQAFSVVFALCIAAAVVVFAGCKDEPDEKGSLIGTWIDRNAGDSYTISATTVTYTSGYKDTEHDPTWFDSSFQGKIVNDPSLESENGIIIIEYTTKPIDGVWNDNGDLIETTGSPDGNYIALYWKNLSAGSVELATAIDLNDFSNPATGTLEEAKTKFTIEKAGNFVWGYGTYSK